MTDEIRITRRVALPKDFEFYEIVWTRETNDFDDTHGIIALIEEKVEKIREFTEEPSPEISPKRRQSMEDTQMSELAYELNKAGLNPSIIEEGDNTAKLTAFLKDKDKWIEYNEVMKGLGYKWVKDGKDSRWER